jgi:hypothetical protein
METETSPMNRNLSPTLQAKKAARDEKRKRLEAMMKKTTMQVVEGKSIATTTTTTAFPSSPEGKSSLSVTSSGESSSESAPATATSTATILPSVQPPLVQYSSYQHPAEDNDDNDDMEDLERGGGGPGHVVVIDTNSQNQYPNKGQLLREQAQSLIHNVMEPHGNEGVVGDSSLSSPLSSDVDARKKKAMSAALLVVLLYWWL